VELSNLNARRSLVSRKPHGFAVRNTSAMMTAVVRIAGRGSSLQEGFVVARELVSRGFRELLILG